MPDYTKSIDDSPLFQDMRRSSTSPAANKASPLSGSFAAPTVASSLSSPRKSDVGSTGNGAGANAGLAQGFFGVYDGHCGSEAVQFVRDRLHSTVCEHALFWKVRLLSYFRNRMQKSSYIFVAEWSSRQPAHLLVRKS